jgi:ABC-2 type transport system ATP-binding protein
VGRYPLLPQGALVDRGFRVRGLLIYVAGLRGVPRGERSADVERVLQLCGLKAVANAKLNRMSRGWQQRIMIAQCLLGRPPGLLLDEPTLSLDVQASRDCWTMLSRLASTLSVIVATHEASAAIEFSDQLTTVRAGVVGEPLSAVELRSRLRLQEGSPERFLLGLVGSAPLKGRP